MYLFQSVPPVIHSTRWKCQSFVDRISEKWRLEKKLRKLQVVCFLVELLPTSSSTLFYRRYDLTVSTYLCRLNIELEDLEEEQQILFLLGMSFQQKKIFLKLLFCDTQLLELEMALLLFWRRNMTSHKQQNQKIIPVKGTSQLATFSQSGSQCHLVGEAGQAKIETLSKLFDFFII